MTEPPRSDTLGPIRRYFAATLCAVHAGFWLLVVITQPYFAVALAPVIGGYALLAVGLARGWSWAAAAALGVAAMVALWTALLILDARSVEVEPWLVVTGHALGAGLVFQRRMIRDPSTWSYFFVGAAAPVLVVLAVVAFYSRSGPSYLMAESSWWLPFSGVLAAVVGVIGLLRGKTWGLLMTVTAGVFLFGHAILGDSEPFVDVLGGIGGGILCFAILPFARPIFRFLRRPEDH